MATIGLTKLRYAIMKTEDTATTAPEYETPKRLVGINNVSISNEIDKAILYGDNQALATYIATKETTITLEVARLPLEDQAALLGHTYNSETKTMTISASDTAPNVAIMYEVQVDTGETWNILYYKGKFSETGGETNTLGESMEFGLHSLEGTFVARVDNQRVGEIQEGTTATADSWFTSFLNQQGG